MSSRPVGKGQRSGVEEPSYDDDIAVVDEEDLETDGDEMMIVLVAIERHLDVLDSIDQRLASIRSMVTFFFFIAILGLVFGLIAVVSLISRS